ncbi:MAG: YqhA family protein [Moraxellaceae bacterium]
MLKPDHNVEILAENIVNTVRKTLAAEAESKKDQISDELSSKIMANLLERVEQNLLGEVKKAADKQISSDSHGQNKIEKGIESILYRTRWLMAPAYIAVGFLLFFMGIYIVGDVVHIAQNVVGKLFGSNIEILGILIQYDPSFDLTVSVLKTLDHILLTTLIVMVLIGGYENTISKIDITSQSGPAWVGQLDLNKLKAKIAAAIVLISSIHLLKHFMSISPKSGTGFDWSIFWVVIIHMVFVLSALALAQIDRIAKTIKK